MEREYRLPLLISLSLHGVLIGLLAFSLEQNPEVLEVPATAPEQQAVQAVAVDAAQVEAEVERLRNARDAARQAEQQRVQEASARQRQAREQAAQAERKRKAEERRLADLARKRAAEEQRRAEAEKQRQAEEQRLAELERQRTLEAEKRRQEEERQRREEAERKRQAEEERQRLAAEQALKAQLAEEEQRLAAERSRANLRLRAQYVAEISDKVQRNWLRPPGIPAGLRCSVRVRQLPGGEVVGVSIVESSGNVAFDRSVEGAVRKASPLPAPPDPALFEREIDFIFSGD